MPRYSLELIQKKVFISPSQEKILENIPGWDEELHGTSLMDETPSQAAYAEDSSQSSQQRVFDVTGSTLSGASQEPVVMVSPDTSSPRTSDAATREDSYNEAFESDRSQSPSRTLSWSLAQGCKDPKSPTSKIVPEEIAKPPLNGQTMTETDVLKQPIARADAATATISRSELLSNEEARAEKGNVSGTGEGEGGAQETAYVEAMPPGSNVVIGSPGEASKTSSLPWASLGDEFGSGSASAFVYLKRKEDNLPAVADQHPKACQGKDGLADAASPSTFANDAVPTTSISVQIRFHTHNSIVNAGDNTETDRQKVVQDDLRSVGRVGDRVIGLETDHTLLLVAGDDLECRNAGAQQTGPRFERSSARDKYTDEIEPTKPLPSTSRKVLSDAAAILSQEVPGDIVASEGCEQLSPLCPPRPPRAVQEKLDKLRSRSAKKSCRKESNEVRDWSSNKVPTIIMDVLRARAGPLPTQPVTAADLLKTALRVGIPLPPPFHRNYFGDD